MNYDEASKLADEIVTALRPFCHRCEVAGSVRRKKQYDIKDVEIVFIPKPECAREIADLVNKRWGEPTMGKWPSLYCKIRGRHSIDFFTTTKEKWGMIYFIRTGPGEFGQRMLAYWKTITNGGYSEDGILHLADGTLVPTLEEQDVFDALTRYGKRPCPFVAPEKRLATKPVSANRQPRNQAPSIKYTP